VDPMKVEAIMHFPMLMNVPEVHSFMGLVGYYRRFVEGFSKIKNVITELQKKKRILFGTRNVGKHFKVSRSC
jgi:hypothetical protein